jgi:uncharacterized protein YeaO (DUF488 family)
MGWLSIGRSGQVDARRIIHFEIDPEVTNGGSVEWFGKSEMVYLKRVYEPAASGDGVRFLVERLWPRGIKKEALNFDAWLKDAAPSTQLRQWFAHDPEKWEEFQRKYFAELDANPEVLIPIRQALRNGAVTLLFSSHDVAHNNALALKIYLTTRR